MADEHGENFEPHEEKTPHKEDPEKKFSLVKRVKSLKERRKSARDTTGIEVTTTPLPAEIPPGHTSLDDFFDMGEGEQTYWVSENRTESFGDMDDLLGSITKSDVRGESGRVVYKRPTWEETKANRDAMQAIVEQMTPEERHQFIETQLPNYLQMIAKIEMPLKYIPTTAILIDALSKNKNFSDKDFYRNWIASQLVHMVCMQEGLKGPNDLGYIPDTSTSVANIESALVNGLNEYVVPALRKYPDLFGENTKDIYEGFVRRIEANRKMFGGTRVNATDLPPFPPKEIENT